MDNTAPHQFLQRWNAVQFTLIPDLREEYGDLTPKHERLIHILDWVRVEEFTVGWCGVGRRPHERGWLANAFVAKSVLNEKTTSGLIDRLKNDRSLRRICGFRTIRDIPSESTFSRAFEEFTEMALAQRVHEALIKEQLGDQLIGHISRDGTAIAARERPVSRAAEAEATALEQQAAAPAAPAAPSESTESAESKNANAEPAPASAPVAAPANTAKKRGRPRKGEVRPPAKESPIRVQRKQTLPQMLGEIPTACDRGSKCNAQGYKVSWNGYKLHIDTADCGVPISALLSSASMHDSRAAIPLSLITDKRVTNLYDVMDSAYCSIEIQEHCRSLGHIPLIDHNPRGGQKDEFEPADAVRYRERTVAERTNARLKDEFGGRDIMVKGGAKVMQHLMFGILALSADQLMRLRIRQ